MSFTLVADGAPCRTMVHRVEVGRRKWGERNEGGVWSFFRLEGGAKRVTGRKKSARPSKNPLCDFASHASCGI